jgi:G:T-mismatch repair DNA endonuclease (very short patch repair protein)
MQDKCPICYKRPTVRVTDEIIGFIFCRVCFWTTVQNYSLKCPEPDLSDWLRAITKTREKYEKQERRKK